MKTPEPMAQAKTPPTASNSWRDIVQSGVDCAQIEGFALEHLIDLQRNRTQSVGEQK